VAITLLSAHGTAATSATAVCTLPASIPADSYAYLLVVTNANAVVSTFPAGWFFYDTASTGSGAAWLLYRPVGVADSSTTASMVFSGSQRWHTAVLVATGENLDLITAVTSSSNTATPAVPAITPIHNNCMDVVIGGLHGTTGGGAVSATPPAGFTEDQDNSSAVGSGIEVGVYIAHRQLSGQAGTAQGATTLLAVSPTSRAVMWRLALAPTAGLQRARDARLSGQVLSRAVAKMRDARISGQVLIGPPQKTRTGRLSAQVLTYQPPSTSPTTGQIWPRTWPSTHGTVLTVGQLWPRGRP
jgi:hypothetical protein